MNGMLYLSMLNLVDRLSPEQRARGFGCNYVRVAVAAISMYSSDAGRRTSSTGTVQYVPPYDSSSILYCIPARNGIT